MALCSHPNVITLVTHQSWLVGLIDRSWKVQKWQKPLMVS